MNNNISKFLLISCIILVTFFLSFNYVFARFLDVDVSQDIAKQEGEFQQSAGFVSSVEIGDVVAAVIKAFIALLGVIFVILIILAGNKWMNAGGDEEKVREAKDSIQRAIIGLIIIIAAYAITEFVFTRLPWGTGGGGPG